MQTASIIAVAIIGVIHIAISIVEMFFWQIPPVYQTAIANIPCPSGSLTKQP
jgi:hypothetical protein